MFSTIKFAITMIFNSLRALFASEVLLFLTHFALTFFLTYVLYSCNELIGYAVYVIVCPLFALRLSWIFLMYIIDVFKNGQLKAEGKAVLITGKEFLYSLYIVQWLRGWIGKVWCGQRQHTVIRDDSHKS